MGQNRSSVRSKHAVKRGYLTKENAPTVEREQEDHSRRPHFTRDEYAKLRRESWRRIGEIKTRTRTREEKDNGLLLPSNSELKETRRLLYDFIIFMANTGIRASEATRAPLTRASCINTGASTLGASYTLTLSL